MLVSGRRGPLHRPVGHAHIARGRGWWGPEAPDRSATSFRARRDHSSVPRRNRSRAGPARLPVIGLRTSPTATPSTRPLRRRSPRRVSGVGSGMSLLLLGPSRSTGGPRARPQAGRVGLGVASASEQREGSLHGQLGRGRSSARDQDSVTPLICEFNLILSCQVKQPAVFTW